jgi:t-SNARE complex subunit (syntaxin)
MTPPPRGIGGVELPPRDWGTTIEALRAHLTHEQERLEKGLLSLEKRYYDIERSISELSVAIEQVQRRIDEGKRDSIIDAEFEAKVLAAIQNGNAKSEPPDIEFAAPSGRRVRGNGWGVFAIVVLAIVALMIVAIFRGPQFVAEIRKALP